MRKAPAKETALPGQTMVSNPVPHWESEEIRGRKGKEKVYGKRRARLRGRVRPSSISIGDDGSHQSGVGILIEHQGQGRSPQHNWFFWFFYCVFRCVVSNIAR